jgi:hypothetical protein
MKTAALASNAAQPDLTVFAPTFAPPGVASCAIALRLRRDLPTSVLLLRAKLTVTAMASHEKLQLPRQADRYFHRLL